MSLSRRQPDPQEIEIIELTNVRGDSLQVLTLGAIIKEWNINTKKHGLINIVLGYLHEQSYLKDIAYHGAIIGRYCNIIANSRFSIGSQEFQLASNKHAHHRHGGPQGFNSRIWQIKECDKRSVTLYLQSLDGDQGYPGNLDVWLQYTLDDEGALNIEWKAQTDHDTIVSLTNHSYFNLSGCGDIRDHYLRIAASHYTPTTSDLIPTGEIRAVKGSALDLRTFTNIDQLINSGDPEIVRDGGVDHNWVSDSNDEMTLCAELFCPGTQLLLQTSSTLPGIQCYTGNGLSADGIHGCHEGVCLETQHYPNSPNEPRFPSPLLRTGETIRHSTRYRIKHVYGKKILDNACSESASAE